MRYRFDAFEVDADRLELRRDGVAQRVEPRVLELVVYLLEHRDRLVTKEELVERLWQARAISDAALSRCLYQARRALGDETSAPRYLKTVHGRGLRFGEEVEVVEIGGGGAAIGNGMAEAAAPAAGTPAAGTPAVEVVAAEAATAAVRRSPGRARGMLVTTGILCVALAAALVFTRPFDASSTGESSVAAADERPILAVLPLSIEAGESSPEEASELDLLALSIVDLLRNRLASVPGIETRSVAVAEQAATQAGSLRETAERAGATHLVSGALVPEGPGAQLTLELFDLRPDRPVQRTPLGRFAVPRLRGSSDLSEFFRVRDAIAQRAVRLVGSPYLIEGPEPGATRDPEAWRFYVLAYQRLSDDFCGGSRPAIELLERALEVDPDFGLAWEALATARYNRFWACGEDAAILERVLAADERALAVAPQLVVPRMRRISMRIESGRVEEAYELTLTEVAAHPDEPVTMNAQTYALRYAGFLERSAESLDRLLERDPLCFAVGAMGGSPNTYLYQGRYERFLAAAPASEMAYHRWYRGFVAVLLDRPDEARRLLEPAFRSAPGEIFGGLSHALLALLDGDLEAARAIVASVSRQRELLGASDGEITYKQAQVLALAGDRQGALAELARTVDQGFFCLACLRRDPTLAMLHGEPGWEQVLAAARDRHLAFAARFGLDPELE